MGYLHIENLYKNVDIMLFKECYALEKIHGTSAHISWKDKQVTIFSGGEKHARFVKLFDVDKLTKLFEELFQYDVTVFGEAYGGSQQGMSETYGKELKFVAFDVRVDNYWLDVPNAEDVTKKLGLEFVYFTKIPAQLESINLQRDLPSVQAARNGITEDKLREGIVLRPLIEVIKKNGGRIIVKHKGDSFKETKTKREVDPAKLKLFEDAKAIAEEFVTPNRLKNIISHIKKDELIIENTGKIIKIFIEDIYREAKGEIIESIEVKRAISKKVAILYKKNISKI